MTSKTKSGPISADRLRSFIERIEKLDEERGAIGGDIRDVYSEAKGVGYDVKTMRKIVQLRKMDAAERDEQEALLDVYRHALGMPGATYRSVAAEHGLTKSKLHRLVPRDERGTSGTAPDVATGEIVETQQTADVAVAPGEGSGTAETSGPAPDLANPSRDQGVDPPGDDAGHLSPPSRPAAQAVNPDPPPERASLHVDTGKGDTPAPISAAEEAAARKFMGQDGITVEVSGAPGSLFDRLGQVLEQVAPGRVQRHVTVGGEDDDLTVPAFLRRQAAE